MKKILITGANSYIGISFKNYLSTWKDMYQVDELDLKDGTWKEKSFKDYDVVFHVAGIAHSDMGKLSVEKVGLYRDINTNLAIAVAKKAKEDGIKQFIFMSSIIIYGDSAPIGKEKVITKDTKPEPSNFYGDSKLQAEIGIRELEDDSFKVVIIRSPMVYGNNSKGNFKVLQKFAFKYQIFPKIENKRSMIYIGNLIEFLRLMVVNEERGIFYPQNREYVNTSELVKLLAETKGKKVIMISGIAWVLKIMSHFTVLVNKAFGSLVYSHDISEYHTNYILFSLKESIDMMKDK